jgi:hypothetical protein
MERPRVRMIRAATTDTTCVPLLPPALYLLPPALYLTVLLRFTSAGSRPRSSEPSRMRKFDCTQPSRPAGIATGDEFRPIQDRSPMTAKSPFGGSGARRTCTATRSITSRKGCGPPPPRSVIVPSSGCEQ